MGKKRGATDRRGSTAAPVGLGMLLEGLEGLLELGLRQPRLRGDLEEGLSPAVDMDDIYVLYTIYTKNMNTIKVI